MIVNGGLETNLICQVFIDQEMSFLESPTFVHCVEIFEASGKMHSSRYGWTWNHSRRYRKDSNITKMVYVILLFIIQLAGHWLQNEENIGRWQVCLFSKWPYDVILGDIVEGYLLLKHLIKQDILF